MEHVSTVFKRGGPESLYNSALITRNPKCGSCSNNKIHPPFFVIKKRQRDTTHGAMDDD